MAATYTLSATGEAHTVPEWTHIRQRFDESAIADVDAATKAALCASGIELKRGGTVAITVGSRGIANITAITRAVAEWCKEQGAAPFVVPSMGTHGGATAEGQQEMIEGLGCTEEAIGCPIKSSMEVVELPRGEVSCPVLHDKFASEADSVIVVNRIKPHTHIGTAAFLKEQPFQSGLFKMMVIGLGNLEQAKEVHAGNYPRRMNALMPAVARRKVELSLDGSGSCNIAGGLAIVENAYDQTMVLEAMRAEAIEAREPPLLALACEHMPRLCSDKLDVLLVDETGKNISGTGMDTNIVGRVLNPAWDGFVEPPTPVVKAIGIHRLTEKSHGNGGGMALADIVSKKFFTALDLELTWQHMVACNWPVGGKIPVCVPTDAEVFLACARTAGIRDFATCRAARIVNTLRVGEAWVSPALLAELKEREDVEVLRSGLTVYDAAGALLPFDA